MKKQPKFYLFGIKWIEKEWFRDAVKYKAEDTELFAGELAHAITHGTYNVRAPLNDGVYSYYAIDALRKAFEADEAKFKRSARRIFKKQKPVWWWDDDKQEWTKDEKRLVKTMKDFYHKEDLRLMMNGL